MRENILYAIAGVVLGFFIGFFFANANWKRPQPGAQMTSAAREGGVARPLDETRMSGQLPPDHPNLGDGGGAPAATSAQAQSAMDTADRNPRDYDAQMTAAANFYQLRDFNKAVVYLNRALAARPNDADALTALGDTKYDIGDYTSAAEFYQRSLKVRPNDANVRTDLGNTYFQRQPPDFDRAIAEYRKSLEIDPRHEKTLQNIVAAALRKEDKALAREFIDKLAAVNPSNPALPSLRSNLNAN